MGRQPDQFEVRVLYIALYYRPNVVMTLSTGQKQFVSYKVVQNDFCYCR